MSTAEFTATSSNTTLADGFKARIERRACGGTRIRDYRIDSAIRSVRRAFSTIG